LIKLEVNLREVIDGVYKLKIDFLGKPFASIDRIVASILLKERSTRLYE